MDDSITAHAQQKSVEQCHSVRSTILKTLYSNVFPAVIVQVFSKMESTIVTQQQVCVIFCFSQN